MTPKNFNIFQNSLSISPITLVRVRMWDGVHGLVSQVHVTVFAHCKGSEVREDAEDSEELGNFELALGKLELGHEAHVRRCEPEEEGLGEESPDVNGLEEAEGGVVEREAVATEIRRFFNGLTILVREFTVGEDGAGEEGAGRRFPPLPAHPPGNFQAFNVKFS
jgi:hypothetical protein